MKKLVATTAIKASEYPESYLSDAQKRGYVADMCQKYPGACDQEGIGRLARIYGLNLIEMLDVFTYGVSTEDIVCNKPGASYDILAFEN